MQKVLSGSALVKKRKRYQRLRLEQIEDEVLKAVADVS
jgi:hypothetical protein